MPLLRLIGNLDNINVLCNLDSSIFDNSCGEIAFNYLARKDYIIYLNTFGPFALLLLFD